MNINRINDKRPDLPNTPVTLKQCGNIYEIRYVKVRSSPPIQKINQDFGMDLRTGEVIEYKHLSNRSEDKASVAQSLKRLRDIINANMEKTENVLWVTLTYAENMTDTERLYQDYRKFWQRFRYYLKKKDFPDAGYIVAAEPQGRGAWHMHLLILFEMKAPFIPNSDIAELWTHGFTKTQSLKHIDNPGLYLTAYLGDMEINEAILCGKMRGRLKEVSGVDGKRKAIIKGARLSLYPPGFNLYRCSRKIKRPVVTETTEADAQYIIGDAELVYEKTIALMDESGVERNIINYRQYNKIRSKCVMQEGEENVGSSGIDPTK